MSKAINSVQTKNDAKDKYVLRFHDEDQRVDLKCRAAKSKRTMNAEILFLLEEGIKAVDGGKNAVR